MSEERHGFEAEVSKILHMMVHSVYSEREVFIRELVSNASDACDKLRYEAITTPDLIADNPDFAIHMTADPEAKTLVISDNGIGMDRDEMIENLGTIARSGTSKFAEQLSGDAKQDVSLIGQFGVGFYSAFMVADKVDVLSKKAGSDKAHEWSSDGLGEFVIRDAEKASRGTDIIMHLKDDAEEFLERFRLEHIVKTYSDHVAVPITLSIVGEETKKGDDDEEAEDPSKTPLNTASALWLRAKSDISDEQYNEFYRSVSHAFDDPSLTLHYKAEGVLEYSVLLYIPTNRPHDLFDPARKSRVKLYVRRVFISDECEDIIPSYLRFMRGVIDSQDLPLNISREMLQNNPVVTRIRKAVTNKILSTLEKTAEKQPEEYAKIWDAFGPVIKEGLYEDHERRESLLKLTRFKSTHSDDWTSLADYVSRMKDKQNEIYYITGPNEAAVRNSPQLEGFKDRDIEVLLLSDPVDDFWLTMVGDFDGKPLKSVTKGGVNLDDVAEKANKDDKADNANEDEVSALIAILKDKLGEQVKDVRSSGRLSSSAVCLVADDNDMDMHLERLLSAQNAGSLKAKRILEINPSHNLIKAMASKAKDGQGFDDFEDWSLLLLDQAKILEGDELDDVAAFAKRMSKVMASGIA